MRAIDDEYNPRKIIRMAILGMRERVLSSDFIWLCSACYTCHQRCPQEVKITDVMEVLKNLAVKEGYIHPSLIMQAELIGNLGRLYAIEEFDNRRRIKIGLPLVHPKCDEIVQLFEVTGLVKLVYEREKESK